MNQLLHFMRFFASLLLLAVSALSWAYDFEVDGIYYDKNSNGISVTVTYKTSSDRGYSGSVTIPSDVVYNHKKYMVSSIGSSAFKNCSGLRSITIPKNVTSISVNAFRGCDNLAVITVTEGNTKYDSRKNCDAIIETATNTLVIGCNNSFIPESVTIIGPSAFYGCSNIKSVIIPNSVMTISKNAFYNCSNLTSITIPESVKIIDSDAFSGCTSLPVIDGLRYADTYLIGAVDKTRSSYNIKDDTRYIGSYAFSDCSDLTSITIPENVKIIDSDAFSGCTSLPVIDGLRYADTYLISAVDKTRSSYNIKDDTRYIGSYAFSGCSSLTSVTIPNSVTSIDTDAFYGCSELNYVTLNSDAVVSKEYNFNNNIKSMFGSQVKEYIIGSDVTKIGDYAFYNCSYLTSITIPDNVTSIGSYAFSGCSGLTKAEFASIESLSSISFENFASNPLSYAHHLYINGEEIKDLAIPNNVTCIGDYAFYNCFDLTSVSIPNSVTSIGRYAFSDCANLKSITIPNSVLSISEDAFYNCSGLTKAEFANIESLCNISFEKSASNPLCYAHHLYINNKEITDLTIPNSVTNIGNNVFSGCSGLTSIMIPNSVTSIGDGAFMGCTRLKSITIPNSVTSIGSYAFASCSSLNSITIPNSVTNIGESAFSDCKSLPVIDNLRYADTYLIGVHGPGGAYNIKDGTRFIGSYAFYNFSGLTSITIPNSVTSIGTDAFYGCSGLTSVTLNSNSIVSKEYSSDNNIKSIFGSQVKEFIIGKDVTDIGSYAFYNYSNLTSVTIGNSVKSIGEKAFYFCSGLTSVIIPSSMKNIGSESFGGCASLTSITLNSNAIVSKAYDSSSNIGSLFGSQVRVYIIGNDVTSIGSYAFRGCSNLSSITIGNSVKSIGESAFYICSGLNSVTIPNSVTTIGANAFAFCHNLTKAEYADIKNLCGINFGNKDSNPLYHAHRLYLGGQEITQMVIPEGVKKINNYTFCNYYGLISVTIPHTIEKLGDEAFYGCSNLSSVTCLAVNVPVADVTAFKNISNESNLFVPVNAIEAYRAVSPWKDFYSILPAGDDLLSIECDIRTASSLTCRGAYLFDDAEIVNSSLMLNGETVEGNTITSTGLNPNERYGAKYTATIKYDNGDEATLVKEAYYTTDAFLVSTSAPKVISVGNAIIAAQTNLDDAETNVGFEWRRTDWTDDFPSNTGDAYLYEGTMEGYIRNLNAEKLWKYRPYYLSDTGIYYYGDWMGLDPTNTSYFEPTVHTYANVNIKGNTALVRGYALRGTDDIRVQGFKYWRMTLYGSHEEGPKPVTAASVPSDAITVESEGRVMETELKGLNYGTTYAYVAFITTTEGETFYGVQQMFTTEDDPMGIELIPEEEPKQTIESGVDANAPIYDLMGRRLQQKPVKGYYIQGGKKYLAQ